MNTRDQKRALGMAARGGSRKITEIAEQIGALHHDAGGFIIDNAGQILGRENVGRSTATASSLIAE